MEQEIKEAIENEAEVDEVRQFYRQMGIDEKGIDAFFLEIIRAEIGEGLEKVGNLNDEELGEPILPVRTLLEISNDCEMIPSMTGFSGKFKKQAENIIATSLSRQGFLIKARITQKKELLDKEKKKPRKGLFGRKE